MFWHSEAKMLSKKEDTSPPHFGQNLTDTSYTAWVKIETPQMSSPSLVGKTKDKPFHNDFVPESMKHGIIITLHKGGRKSKKVPNNYRAITLTSSILKLFERLILDRLYNSLEKPFNFMQAGFRTTSLH